MDFDCYRQILSSLKEIGVRFITLTGGDPVTYPWLTEAITEAKKNDFAVVIISSGIGVDRDLCSRLFDSGLNEFHISLNGSTQFINNLSRSHYTEAINAIKFVKEQNIVCVACWVARKDNFHDLQNYINLCLEMKVDRIFILKNKRNIFGDIDGPLSDEDITEITEILKPFVAQKYVTVEACFTELSTMIKGRNLPLILRQCTGGIDHFDIFVDGSFSPCRKTNIREPASNMTHYWNYSEKLMQKRMNNHFRVCQ